MSFVISDDILHSVRMDEGELKREIAVLLYQKQRLTLAKAAKFAEMNRIKFQRLLAFHRIPLLYDVEDLESDLDTLNQLAK